MLFCIYNWLAVGGGLEEHAGNKGKYELKVCGGFRFEGLYVSSTCLRNVSENLK